VHDSRQLHSKRQTTVIVRTLARHRQATKKLPHIFYIVML
jgi:hypothetical protein